MTSVQIVVLFHPLVVKLKSISALCSLATVWSVLTLAAPVQAFIFDTFGDGFWTIINNGNANNLVVNATGASQAVATNSAFQQQFELLYNEEDGTFRVRNHDSWLCIGALNGATANGTPVVTVATYTAATSQKWNFVTVSSGVYQLVNVASGLALQTDNGSPAKVTLQPVAANSYQYWHFAFQTHYPKKGLAGWDSSLPRFNASWLYNWGWSTGEALSESQVFAPMQWGNWGVGTLNNVTEKPFEVLTFNEPDGSGQADMTTAQAIALWPQLQALNLPLLSPAPASLFGGWLADFYNQISANGYRVDYTAIHDYPSDTSASDLMSTLYSAYSTWGRSVWLTEFSVVDWAGTHTWSEQDNYRFLAEFMWQAEGGGNEWLKRYSLFLFAGTPSVNPWDGNGHRSDVFLADNYTFTPLGELYAGWDADLTLHPQTPYFIHNCATCFRMSAARNANGLSAYSIRHEDATMQWIITNAPTSGHYYIQSLGDGRRLRYSSSVLDLAAPGTTGATLEWSFNGPDANGYYYIDNPNGSVSLSGSGSGAAGVFFGAVASGSPSDNTRWRFVKPYYPVSLAAVAIPTALAATPADRSVTLRWSGGAPRYNIYRSTISGSGYAKINGEIKRNYYTDNTAVNGTKYFYVVASLDSLENESGYSTQVAAAPASGLNLGLVAEYKFENGAQDSSGNGFSGSINGITSTVAGVVDGSAINFTGGDDSYVEIPNPLGNDFTISFWLNTTATGGTGQWYSGKGLVDGEVPGATNDFGVSLIGTNVAFGVGNPDTTITSSVGVSDGAWHHIAAVRTSISGAMLLYVDGILRASGTGATGTHSTPVALHLGNLQSGLDYFAGSIDEVRLYNTALNAAQVTALATPASTLVAYYNLEGNAQDSSGFGNTGYTNGGVSFVAGKVGSQAAQFDGASSYIEIPVAVASDFSIAYWMKTTATGGSGQWWSGMGMVDGDAPGTAADFGTSLLGSHAAFGVGNPDTTVTSGLSINDGNWHHIAAMRLNATGLMKLYVDGNLQYTTAGPTNVRSAPTGLRLGGIQSGGGLFSGTLDDVRLYNYQLNASQISALVSPQPLPAPWTNADVGAPASPGYSFYATNTGTWSLGGGGADIWLAADQFQFAYTNFSDNGSLVARVTSGAIISDGTTNANAKTGIMFRASAATNAQFVALVHDQTQGIQFLYRDATGANAGQVGTNLAANPAVWFRLVRSNNTFTAYYATTISPPTPATWITIGTHTTSLASAALAGVVACAHNNAKLANTTFASVAVSSPTPPAISVTANQIIGENTATPVLPVTIGDSLVTGNNLTLAGSSSNTNLIPNANLSFGGSGNYRTVQVTPAAYQAGTAIITLVLNNNQPSNNTATNTFQVIVTTTPAGYWREQYFGTTQNSGAAADESNPAGDGVSNVLKRFFGLSPLLAYPPSVWPYARLTATNFTVNYTHSLLATDLTWQVQWSPDLLAWLTNLITDVGVTTNGNTEVRQGSIPTDTGDPLFLRVQVTSP